MDVPTKPEPTTDELAFASEKSRITVPVSVAGAGSYPFIIDTGAQRTVISRELAAELGLPRGHVVRLAAKTGKSEVATVLIPSISC